MYLLKGSVIMKVFIIILTKKFLTLMGLLLIFLSLFIFAFGTHTKISPIFNNNSDENNQQIKNLLNSLMCQEKEIIYEDDNRTVHKNLDYLPPSPLPTFELNKVLNEGVEIKFRILSDEPLYLRPVYDPDWKLTYYRGWLDLPFKNMEARHKMFAFSLGLSMNYDIFGSLGYNPSVSVNAHKNINFLIYGFNVENVKLLENQVALIGEPKQSGAQIISIIQNDLLAEGVDTKDFIFQLSTRKGYEVDFLRENIIRYEYLMQKIKEHTVGAFNPLHESKDLEQLIQENNSLQQELSYFIPLKDEIIYQQNCDSAIVKNKIDNLQSIITQGKKIPFNFNYRNPLYKRPLYDPLWKANYKRNWCYIPTQIEYNLHRILIIPKNHDNQKDFFGKLGFQEKFQPIKPQEYGLMVYNFNVSDIKLYKNQLLLIGTPSRTGAQILSISKNSIADYGEYIVKLTTPDNSEIDCNILKF